MKNWKPSWPKIAFGAIITIAAAIYIDASIGIAIFLLGAIGLAGALAKRHDAKYQAILNETPISKDPSELIEAGYEPLTNISCVDTSIRSPRPGKIIFEYLSQGYDIRLCYYAKDNRNQIIPKNENIYSVWGKIKTLTA